MGFRVHRGVPGAFQRLTKNLWGFRDAAETFRWFHRFSGVIQEHLKKVGVDYRVTGRFWDVPRGFRCF